MLTFSTAMYLKGASDSGMETFVGEIVFVFEGEIIHPNRLNSSLRIVRIC